MRRLVLAAALLSLPARAQTNLPDVAKRLRAIEVAALKGQGDAMRIDLQEQARNKPGDVMLRIYVAWCGIPSDDAWNQLKGIATVNPDNPWVHLGMGRIYARWKMRDQSDAELKLALKANPRFYPAMVGLGDLARAQSKLADAEKLYRDALAAQDDAEGRGGLGLTLLAAGRPDEAKKELERAYQLWPEQPPVLAALGRMAREAKDPKAAAQYLGALAQLSPKDREARRLLADLQFEQGQQAEAAKEYEAVLRLGAPDQEVLQRLAGLYKELGNGEGEEHALGQLAGLDKTSAAAPLRLAELAEARGALDEAEGQLLEANHRAPNVATTLTQLARTQAKRDELKDARESYLAALASPGERPPEVDQELAELTARLKLPKKPAHGSVDDIYGIISQGLNAVYAERLKEKGELGGQLKVRAKLDGSGKATAVEVAMDTVGDAVIAGHVYFAIKDAQYPKSSKALREPIFEFELKPPKKP